MVTSSPKKNRRFCRHRWDTRNLEFLETIYKTLKFPTAHQCKDIANVIKCSHRTVQIWFQNKRQRDPNTIVSLPTVDSVPSQEAIFDAKIDQQEIQNDIWLLLDSVPENELSSQEHISSISQLLDVNEQHVRCELMVYLHK
tara:strand:+ start:44 stop:466 length:423 start_codon:yes stop_codon:yes gene_type:complete